MCLWKRFPYTGVLGQTGRNVVDDLIWLVFEGYRILELATCTWWRFFLAFDIPIHAGLDLIHFQVCHCGRESMIGVMTVNLCCIEFEVDVVKVCP